MVLLSASSAPKAQALKPTPLVESKTASAVFSLWRDKIPVMATKKIPYINRFNGNIVVVSKQHAKKLNEDWSEVKFIKNKQGERVMRMELHGATVDVSEVEQPIKGKHINGNRSAK